MASDAFHTGLKLSDCEPTDWFVVFHPETTRSWVRWLAWGRYKHVSAFGFIQRAQSWVFFDVHLDRTKVFVVGDHEAQALLGHYADGNTVVRLARPMRAGPEVNLAWGGWCVPAVAHLVGLKSCALRPDAFFRQCLANGGEIIGSEKRDETQGAGRSGAEAPAGGSDAGEDQHDPGSALLAD